MIGKNKNIARKNRIDSALIKKVILSQYESSLLMLMRTITKCDNNLWESKDFTNEFWHICYHALFYTDLYLSSDEYSFTPWPKHKKEYQFMGKVPYEPYHKPVTEEVYSQIEVQEYLNSIFEKLDDRITETNLEDNSGFFWLPFTKLELHFYNIRHIQHHTAQLVERLREKKKISIDWVGYSERNE